MFLLSLIMHHLNDTKKSPWSDYCVTSLHNIIDYVRGAMSRNYNQAQSNEC